MATHVQEKENKTYQRKRRGPWLMVLVVLLALGSFVLTRGVCLEEQGSDQAVAQTEMETMGGEQIPQLPAKPQEPVEPQEPETPEEPNIVPEEPAEPSEDWRLLLVNKTTPLPDGYEVPELTQLTNGHSIDSRAYPELQQMMDDCRAAGNQPRICSSYRPHETQVRLFNNKMDRLRAEGVPEDQLWDKAAEWVAVPGTSEHEGGLALDIVDLSYQLLDDAQEDTPAQQWLMAHCQDYGFILRYPKDKVDITGIGYEPWHYRYVGKEAAQEIMSKGICLEEYLAQ